MKHNQSKSSNTRQEENTPKIVYWKEKDSSIINPDLFDNIAEEWAKKIANDHTGFNNYSQIRKFYDEVILVDQKLSYSQDPVQEFIKVLPYLKMLKAKSYYSHNRKSQNKKLVGKDFVDFIKGNLEQIKDYEDFKVFKTFFEAFMGFLKYYKPD